LLKRSETREARVSANTEKDREQKLKEDETEESGKVKREEATKKNELNTGYPRTAQMDGY
jgi:hypothetical protein